MKKYIILFAFIYFLFYNSFSQDLNVCQDANNLYGYCDSTGKILIPYQYDYAKYFINGHAVVSKNKKMGLINNKGELLIPYKYTALYNIDEVKDKFLVNIDSTWGFINLKGEPITGLYRVIDPGATFDLDGNSYSRVDKWFDVSIENKFGLMNMKGEFLCQIEFDKIEAYQNKWFIVSKNNNLGLMNSKGKYLCNIEYDFIRLNELTSTIPDSNSVCFVVLKNGKFSLKNSSCNPLSDYDYDDFLGFWENNSFFIKDKNVEIINCINGTKISKVESENKIEVIINSKNKSGLISSEGKIIIPFNYDYITHSENENIVSFSNSVGLIDNEGNSLIETKYKTIYSVCYGDSTMFAVGLESKIAIFIITEKGKPAKQITDFKYDSIDCNDIGIANVKIKDKIGTVDKTGKVIWK